MKINIIGPSCVGKTTLAKYLEKKYELSNLDLDLIMIDHEKKNGVGEISFQKRDKYLPDIKGFMNKNKDWVIEGVYPVKEIFDEADVIIFIKLFFLIPIVRQWKRYFTDEYQRKTYGFLSNITYLTPDIVRQYFFVNKNKIDINNPLDFSVGKCQEVLRKYHHKMVYVNKPMSFRNYESFLKKKECFDFDRC